MSKSKTILHLIAEKNDIEIIDLIDNHKIKLTDTLDEAFYSSLYLDTPGCAQMLLENGVTIDKIKINDILRNCPRNSLNDELCMIKNIFICCQNIMDDSILQTYITNLLFNLENMKNNQQDEYLIILQLLLDSGINMDKSYGGNSCTILHVCCARGYNDYVKILIDNKVNLNLQNSNGINALIISIQSKKTECALLLIEAGANLDLSFKGETALMIAIRKNNILIIKELLNKGANINILNNKLQSARDIAHQLGHWHIKSKLNGFDNKITFSTMAYVKFFIMFLILIIIFKIF